MAERTVYFAKISREPRLFDRTFRDDLLDALDPHKSATRYNRRWRFSRPVETEGYINGKLGFIRQTQAEEMAFDEEREDFVTTEAIATQGSFSMFVIDPVSEILAFEERPPAIRRQSFVGAFKSLLAESDFPATVALLSDPAEFHEFVASVDRISRIRAVVYRPNPGWRDDAEHLQQIVEQAAAERAEVVAVAPEGGGLNASARWIEGALGQIAEHGQGNLKATGYVGHAKRTWTFGARLRIVVIRDEDAIDAEGVWGWIRDRLRDLYER